MLLTLPLLPLTLVLSWGGFLIVGSNALAGIGIAAMFVAMPAATVVAVVRHDLFDVDRAIVAAAVYTILTGAVVGPVRSHCRAERGTARAAVACAVGAGRCRRRACLRSGAQAPAEGCGPAAIPRSAAGT